MNKNQTKPSFFIPVLFVVVLLLPFPNLVSLMKESDLINLILSINWSDIFMDSVLLLLYYSLIFAMLPSIVWHFNQNLSNRMREGRSFMLSTIPLSITTSMLLNMTIEELELFSLVASLAIIYQIFVRGPRQK